MKYRPFGKTGWNVSEIGFGGGPLGSGWGPQSDEDSIQALHTALDLGCNFIDTALGYGDGKSETLIGKVLKERGGERVYVSTKVPPVPGSWPPAFYDKVEERYPEKHLREGVESCLRRLQTDCLDVLHLHTWTRAWNRNPVALETLRTLKQEGKIGAIAISSPECDQNSLIDLMRGGWLDAVQVIYNIFEQEAMAELFPVARECGVGVIVRVPLDESALAGKFTRETKLFPEDFRSRYFSGDRMPRTVERVEKIRTTVGTAEQDLATAALKFAMKPAAVSVIIPGMRNAGQARRNCAVSDQLPLSDELESALRLHHWSRGNWYEG